MMRAEYHLAMSSLLGGASFLASGSPALAVSVFAAGFLVDGDHLFDYALYCYRQRRRPNVREFVRGSFFAAPGKVYVPLHSYELVPAIWLVALSTGTFWWSFWLSLSLVLHLIADHLTNKMHPLSYFMTFRVIKKFDEKVICLKPGQD